MYTVKEANVDQALVERAQNGDTEAFGELIEQHRGRIRGWVERVTKDSYMADDIVQDAFIRAFMHVGTLTDTSRFLPWLHRIVRNQANMRLRRGGAYRKEMPFAAMGTDGNDRNVEWDDLDSILYHLARKATDAATYEQDPAESLLRKEVYETIHALLHCLNPKEKGIFKAFFFRQLGPEEIATLYKMPTSSIYTYIYRSRQKLRKEHARISLSLLKDQGEGRGLIKSKILQWPDKPEQSEMLVTLVDSLKWMLDLIGEPRETSELMGVSTLAFRMKISERTTFADGIYVFDWKQTVKDFAEILGYQVSLLFGQLSGMPVPLLAAVERFPVVLPIEEAVLPFIRRYINLGKPVLYFDTMAAKPYVHEWSVIYGYDDERRVVHVTDQLRPEGKILSYDDVTHNPVRFLAGIDGKLEQAAGAKPLEDSERRKQAERTVRFAVNYARNGCDYRPKTDYLRYSSGLAAYDQWIGYMSNPHMVPNRYGMGHLTAYYSETKKQASLYLRNVPFEGEAMRLTLLASEAFEQAAEQLEEMSEVVPFVRASELMTAEIREKCKVYLNKAKEFESAAIGYLEKAITWMR